MAEGFRITESGDSRVTESSDSRVTEGFVEGLASLAAAATIAVVASVTVFAETDRQGVGSKLFAGVGEFQGLSELNSEGTVSSVVQRKRFVDTSLESAGNLATASIRERPGSTSLLAEGALDSEGLSRLDGASSLGTLSSINVLSARKLEGLFGEVSEEANRETESGDIRVTESGDTRITNQTIFNQAEGTLVSTNENLIEFNATAFYKQDGVWKPFVPYVKNSSVWQQPLTVYKNIGGSWKRIY